MSLKVRLQVRLGRAQRHNSGAIGDGHTKAGTRDTSMIDDRDYIGYGANPPDPQWPGGARIGVNINLNFEGGGERSVMDGDGVSEGMLNDIGFPSLAGVRSPMVESVFEYGSRVGGWRLLRLFRRFGTKVCLLAVAKAAERNPELTRAFAEDGHE